MMRFWKGFVLLTCLMLWGLTGCGREDDVPDRTQEEAREEQIYYHIQETAVPDPDEALVDVLPENGRAMELDLMLSRDRVYRVVQLRGTLDGIDDYPMGCCIQILEPPYKQWDNYLLPMTPDYWEGLNIGSNYLVFVDIGEDVYGILDDKYLVRWNTEGTSEFICELPESFKAFNLTRLRDGGFCGYDGQRKGNYVILDSEMQVQKEGNLGGRPYGIVEDPKDGTLLWYGEKEEGFGVWRLDNGKAVMGDFKLRGDGILDDPLFEGINLINVSSIHLAVTEAGKYYLADKNKLWRFEEDREPEPFCNFPDRDYLLDSIEGMTVLEDGGLLLLAGFEGDSYILQMTESETPPGEKQEIVLAARYMQNSSLKDLVARFNRRSEDYHITILMPEGDSWEAYKTFGNTLQMEISAGRGPDLISGDVMNVQDLAENGYLQSLDGTLVDEEVYLPSAMEYGKIKGVCYGIPYESKIYYLATCSQTLAGERDSWTLREMMDAVEASNAKILARDMNGSDIVCLFGLYDNGNRELIDWEKGECYLTEEPFLELLEFAKKYQDIWHPDNEEIEEALWNGEVAFDISTFDTMDTMKYLEACFQGEPALLGLPRTEGNGIYMAPNLLCLSANSDKKEGAQEFLRFLLSKESQDYYIRYGQRKGANLSNLMQSYSPVYIAVRRDVLEESIQLEMNKKPQEMTYLGIHYSTGKWSEQQAEEFRFLIENSRPANWYALDIQDMVYEELAPYFDGQRSAKEVSEILNNRVQVYMDERK